MRSVVATENVNSSNLDDTVQKGNHKDIITHQYSGAHVEVPEYLGSFPCTKDAETPHVLWPKFYIKLFLPSLYRLKGFSVWLTQYSDRIGALYQTKYVRN